jgi:hypothetical protein
LQLMTAWVTLRKPRQRSYHYDERNQHILTLDRTPDQSVRDALRSRGYVLALAEGCARLLAGGATTTRSKGDPMGRFFCAQIQAQSPLRTNGGVSP